MTARESHSVRRSGVHGWVWREREYRVRRSFGHHLLGLPVVSQGQKKVKMVQRNRERNLMASPYHANQDSFVHVKDCRIWAEIRYLDSPTDYRECLPGRTSTCATDLSSFMMLDASNTSSRRQLAKPLLFLMGIVWILICGYFLYLVLD